MGIQIFACRDSGLLAKLNREIQELHVGIEPEIFKRHSEVEMEKLFAEVLERENTYGYVAFWDDDPAGYVLLSLREYPETPFKYAYTVVYIEQICVLQKFRGQKIGNLLMEQVKTLARERGIHRVELDFWFKNENAGQFFRSRGFQTYNERMYLKV